MIIEYMIRDNKPVIHIFWTDEKGVRHHEYDDKFEPYFYVGEDERIPTSDRIVRVESGTHFSIFGEKVKKVYTKLPSDVVELRDEFKKCYEDNILFPTRYTIDKVKEIKGILRIATIDIEVDDSKGMPDKDEAKQEVISCVIHDSFQDKYYILYWRRDLNNEMKIVSDNEVRMCSSNEVTFFDNFVNVINRINPDVITAWNTDFDIKYVINRMNNLGCKPERLSPLGYVVADREKIMGRCVFDSYTAYKKFKGKQLRSFKLDYVANLELGEGKIHRGSTKEMWMTDIEALIKYNLKDVELVVNLEKKLKFIALYDEVRRITKTDLSRVLGYSTSVDCALLSYCHDKFVLPGKKARVKHKKFEGAVVVKPTKGLYKNVIVCDVTRSYPSAIISCNLSPETFNKSGDIKVSDDLKFVSEPVGVVPSVLMDLINLRNEKKNIMKQYTFGSDEYNTYYTQQFALKSIINTFYGVLGFKDFRLYDDRVASAVTDVGRQLIMWVMDIAKSSGYTVIYSDTDSIFILSKSDDIDNIVKEGFELKKRIVESLDDFAKGLGCKKHVFDLDFEKVYGSILFVDKLSSNKGKKEGAKKKYGGRLTWYSGKKVDEIQIVGFEAVRSDSSIVSKKMQEDLLLMVNSRKSIEVIREEVFKYINEEIKKIKAGKYSVMDISHPAAISKSIESYKVNTMSLRALSNAKFIGKNYKPGDKPLLLNLKKVPPGYPPNFDVVLFSEESDLPKGFIPDYDMIIDKVIRSKVEAIVEAIGFSYDEVVMGMKQSTLW